MTKYPPLPRVDSIDLDAVARGAPVHSPGFVAHWPALHRWTHDYLRAQAGDASFVVETYPEGTPHGRVNCRRMPLAEYLAILEAKSGGCAPFLAETNRSIERNAPVLDQI